MARACVWPGETMHDRSQPTCRLCAGARWTVVGEAGIAGPVSCAQASLAAAGEAARGATAYVTWNPVPIMAVRRRASGA